MGVGTPSNATQVENSLKVDVQREAPDSNPYLNVSWIRSLIAGVARRQFDQYGDLGRTENRLFPDTTDPEWATKWGTTYVGPPNAATGSTGQLVATGTAGGAIPVSAVLTAGAVEYTVTSGGTVSLESISVASITRSGTTATVTTDAEHNLSSFVPVTISGAGEAEYNVTDAGITVTGANTFTYQVSGSPATPATGTILAGFTTAVVTVESSTFGDDTNQAVDSPLVLQSPIVNVDDTLYVTFGALGGGADAESVADYNARYLDKIRNPVAHFSVADIVAKAKEVNGVTRVFVQPSGTQVGILAVTSVTRVGNVATVTLTSPSTLQSGMAVTMSGAIETDYNVENARIIVESTTIFHYIVTGSPSTPATGTILTTGVIPLGQLTTYFMRDNDDDPIPSGAEVAVVKAKLDTISPANTATTDSIVLAPTANPIDYTFTSLLPDTPTMRSSVEASIRQFHDEETSVGAGVTQDAYRAAIQNTVDLDTGDALVAFGLSTPTGDIAGDLGVIETKGTVAFP